MFTCRECSSSNVFLFCTARQMHKDFWLGWNVVNQKPKKQPNSAVECEMIHLLQINITITGFGDSF